MSHQEAMAKAVSGSKRVGTSAYARSGGFFGNLAKAVKNMGPFG